jgi:hypothetical protein
MHITHVSSTSYQDPETYLQDIDPRELHGYRKGNIEIRLVQFSNGTDHKSANKSVIQLDPLGWYDTEFKTHIAIMGDYLVVLLAHYTVLDDIHRTGKYQTGYFVDWVKGHVIQVRTIPTAFESFFEYPMFSCRNGTLLKTPTSQS